MVKLATSSIREVVCGLRSDMYALFYVTMLKAFIDDSGSGGDSPWYVLAGYISSVEDWDEFDPEWKSVLDSRPRIEYFKAREAESRRDQFEGFTEDQRNSKIDSLIAVIQKHVRQAIHVRVKQKHYNRIIKANGVPPRWDNPYYFLFPEILASAVVAEKYFGSSDPLEFVFDSSEQHDKPSRRFYGHAWEQGSLTGRVANVFYRDEKIFLPLQAADLLAWQVRRRFSVSTEPRRVHFEESQKCCRKPPIVESKLTEGSLHGTMAAIRKRDRLEAIAMGLPPDTDMWSRKELD
jgi:hypothetical protein